MDFGRGGTPLSTPFQLVVPFRLLEEVTRQARAELPNECCGFMSGSITDQIGKATHCYPLINAADSPVEYLSDPHSLLAAHKDMRRRGIDIVAVYHSHPTTPPIPSRTDVARNYYEDVIHLIISLEKGVPETRGWWIAGARVTEASVRIQD